MRITPSRCQSLLGQTRLDFGERAIRADESSWIDLLRLVLLSQVVLGHLAAIALPEIPELGPGWTGFSILVVCFRLLTRFGGQAAFLFIVLSGYLVGGPLWANVIDREPVSLADFGRRRFLRIAPSLWIALSLGAAIDLFGAHALGYADLYANQKAYDFVAAMTFRNFVGNILCLQPTLVAEFGSNGPLWTLGYIVQAYVAAILVSVALTRRRRAALAVLAVIGGAGFLFRPEWAAALMLWTVGAMTRNYRAPGWVRRHGWACGGGLIVLANRLPLPIGIPVVALAGVFLIAWLRGATFRLPSRFRSLAASAASGAYETYASHYPVAFFVFAVWLGHRASSAQQFASFLLVATPSILFAAVLVQTAARRIKLAWGLAS